ncbi:MAG TPA: hypothetical protein VH475_16830 [Tepidisphaeraceae bacterium]|jgi:ribosomal protein L7/L12
MPQLSDEQLRSIMDEVRAGRLIQAIKLYRQYTGAGLAQAKRAVEQLAAGQRLDPDAQTPSLAPDLSDEQTQAIIEALAANQKIQAVKLYRQYTGAGLAEAKSAVEQLALDNGDAPDAGPSARIKSGCGAAIVMLIASCIAVYVLAHR